MSAGEEKARYGLLDTLRGLCVASMVCYHGMYDLVNLLGVEVSWFWEWPGYLWQQSVCWGFILLSGLCSRLSRHGISRGLLLLACGAGVSLVTELVIPEERIQYGVLTLLGSCALILSLLSRFFGRLGWKLPDEAGLFASLLLFFLLRDVPQGYLGFEDLRLLEIPSVLYGSDAFALLGFPGPGFTSSDYFPLIPWFFLYLSGYFLWGLLSRSERMKTLLRPGLRPLSFVGRHSLTVYLLHQPLLMGVFLLLSRF